MSQNERTFGPYYLYNTIGEGEFGKVKLARHKDNMAKDVCAKLIKKKNITNPVLRSKLMREISILQDLSHPNIVKLLDVIETETHIGMIMEIASGGELFEFIYAVNYLPEKEACRFFAQLMSGVHYLHYHNYVHRDLKLENLLLDADKNIIITDFGFANKSDGRFLSTSCGSPCYAAPELVISDGYIGEEADIWSCGVILFAMVCGYLPYDDDPNNNGSENINLLYKYILETELIFPNHLSESVCHLIKRMLTPDPKNRAKMTEILKHPWLRPCSQILLDSMYYTQQSHLQNQAPPQDHLVPSEAQPPNVNRLFDDIVMENSEEVFEKVEKHSLELTARSLSVINSEKMEVLSDGIPSNNSEPVTDPDNMRDNMIDVEAYMIDEENKNDDFDFSVNGVSIKESNEEGVTTELQIQEKFNDMNGASNDAISEVNCIKLNLQLELKKALTSDGETTPENLQASNVEAEELQNDDKMEIDGDDLKNQDGEQSAIKEPIDVDVVTTEGSVGFSQIPQMEHLAENKMEVETDGVFGISDVIKVENLGADVHALSYTAPNVTSATFIEGGDNFKPKSREFNREENNDAQTDIVTEDENNLLVIDKKEKKTSDIGINTLETLPVEESESLLDISGNVSENGTHGGSTILDISTTDITRTFSKKKKSSIESAYEISEVIVIKDYKEKSIQATFMSKEQESSTRTLQHECPEVIPIVSPKTAIESPNSFFSHSRYSSSHNQSDAVFSHNILNKTNAANCSDTDVLKQLENSGPVLNEVNLKNHQLKQQQETYFNLHSYLSKRSLLSEIMSEVQRNMDSYANENNLAVPLKRSAEINEKKLRKISSVSLAHEKHHTFTASKLKNEVSPTKKTNLHNNFSRGKLKTSEKADSEFSKLMISYRNSIDVWRSSTMDRKFNRNSVEPLSNTGIPTGTFDVRATSIDNIRPKMKSRRTSVSTASNTEVSKLRYHSGPIDKRAISHRAPKLLIADIISLISDMGMIIQQSSKNNNSFKLKVNRPRNDIKEAAEMEFNEEQRISNIMVTPINEVDHNEKLRIISSFPVSLFQKLKYRVQLGPNYNKGFDGKEGGKAHIVNKSSKEELYGGELKFTIEIQRIKNLKGLYVVEFKRFFGDIWEFKRLYQFLITKFPLGEEKFL
ncbi:hypothetical protein HK099_003970 [Clydaea vesicula]|uniref:Non-specific serine/threonine protein kinase n=1 Tax=Clydaea vesicula TaxID=447962 RepID=A0AAD5UA46_9FUNG|nr:hypothetical protein HK099_003970 [Clydaea vesicula]